MGVPEDVLTDSARKILLARAQRLREKPEEEDLDLFWAAEFPLGGQAFALPLGSLVACQPLRQVTPVPLSDPHLTGITRFQRELLTVFSLSSLVGASGWRRDPSVLLILQLPGGRKAAVDCEEIPRSVGLPRGWVEATGEKEKGSSLLTLTRPGASPLRLIQLSVLFPDPMKGGQDG